VLEAGIGDGVFGRYLAENEGVAYTALDSDEAAGADLTGSVTAIPAGDETFDVAVAFQVLEHLPFSDLPKAVAELLRVARRFVVVSVPDARAHFSVEIKAPLFPRFRFSVRIPFRRPALRVGGEHHWEIGRPGFPVRRVRAALAALAPIREEFVPPENRYHRFFVLEKRASSPARETRPA
jgi:hypothetical protein